MLKSENFMYLVLFALAYLFVYYPWDKHYEVHEVPNNPSTLQRTIDPGFRILTFFSENHFKEALRCCQSLHFHPETKNWKYGTMVTYVHTDVSSESILNYSRLCPMAEVRKYNYSNVPKHVYNLMNYSWKPILVKEFLKEFNNVFYVDSSVVFTRKAGDGIKELFDSMNEFPCGIRHLKLTNHMIYTATDPQMMKYYNMSVRTAKRIRMIAATTFIVTKTKESEQVIDAWADCGMTDGCMAPPGSQLRCNGKRLLGRRYAGCHRYDQSALHILLHKCSPELHKIYRRTDIIKVCRKSRCW